MPRRATSNATGLERSLRALRSVLTPEHEALIALARGLAVAVDAEPNNAALWREYRAALAALTQAGSNDDPDDDTRDFLVTVRTPVRSEVGNSSQP